MSRSFLKLAAVGMLAAMPLPALAGPGECATVLKSFEALNRVPAYATTMRSTGVGVDAVIIGNTAHLKLAGRWTKIPFAKAQREEMLKSVIGSKGLNDCEPARRETIDGRDMTVIRYQSPKVDGLPGLPPKARLWIGSADGLPYRIASDDGKVDMSVRYEGVTAPVP